MGIDLGAMWGYGIYLGVKSGVAAALAPFTGGGSLIVAGVTP